MAPTVSPSHSAPTSQGHPLDTAVVNRNLVSLHDPVRDPGGGASRASTRGEGLDPAEASCIPQSRPSRPGDADDTAR